MVARDSLYGSCGGDGGGSAKAGSRIYKNCMYAVVSLRQAGRRGQEHSFCGTMEGFSAVCSWQHKDGATACGKP